MFKKIILACALVSALTGIAVAQDYQVRDYTQTLILAKQKGWPLTIIGKNGRVGALVGVDPFGLPKYYIENNNAIAAATTRANQLWPGGSTGLNLSGSSANMKNKLGIWDGGRALSTHVELTGRITQKDDATTIDDHATHTTGTMIATGINPNAKGMAFGLQGLIAYDFTNDQVEIKSESLNLLLSNHSYSIVSGWSYNDAQSRWEFYGRASDNEDYKFGFYSNDAQGLDSIAFNAPNYLIVKSAGNNRDENGPAIGDPYYRYNSSGTMAAAGNRPAGISSNDSYNSIPWDANAKNILTVGAVSGLASGYSRPEDVVMSNFSSWGPTDDGRIKPDIVADGISVLSTVATSNTSYGSLSGTSMAAPNAAGSLFLLQEHYSKLKNGAFMRSATLKGLAIHTADEAGVAPGPDYQYGWGLLNVEKGAAVISASVANNNGATSPHLLYENTLANNGTLTFDVIASGKGPLRATIAWTDPWGSVDNTNVLNNPAKKLVNDLDIRIKKVGGNTYLPWTMTPEIPSIAAAPGDNTIDNVERIDIDSTVPGQTYTITVSHKGTLQKAPQAYSLLVSGVGGKAYCASAATDSAGGIIDSVSFKNIHFLNLASATTYTDKTNLVADIEPSETIPLYIRLRSSDGSAAPKVIKVFIDYNNDGLFGTDEVAATSAVLTGGAFTGSVVTPSTLTVGNIFLMRIVLQETSNAADVSACGSYAKGETQDYRVRVSNPSIDMSISEVVTPTASNCAESAQYLTLKIKNNGTLPQSNITVTAEVKSGTTTIASITGTYKGTIPPLSTANFTLQQPFATAASTTYTVSATVNFTGDQYTSNNTIVSTIVTSAPADAPSGTGGICGTNILLKVNSPSATGTYLWYTTATGTTPFASGTPVNTTVAATNNTYYLGQEANVYVGPATKTVYTSGGYNSFSGNYIKFNNSVPVTIESARLYIGNSGSIKFTVANIVSSDSTGAFSYIALASTTINVIATNPNPAPGAVTGNPAGDLGAVYYLNLPVSQTGDHVIIVECQDGATIFRNTNITGTNTYPMAIPGVFSLTGNSANTAGSVESSFYYFFYNVKVRTAGCVSSRVPIIVTTIPSPVISQSGDSLVSNIAGVTYQWYFNENPIANATTPKYKPTQSGTYKLVMTDALNCPKTSNNLPVVITAIPPEIIAQEINLQVSPNPNKGIFNLTFEVKDKNDLTIDILTNSGQRVYTKAYQSFTGKFSKQIQVIGLSSGLYVLKIQHGKKTYIQKMIVQK